ncbi:YncE family protein [Halosquirtibacter laminarini]|uniref:YncE family protein n=1 Tax=Halosquirtibacter laminarini TaxID=3374600 RepID=A0AC61NHI1_9BACT|nr:YncE family protein [Prolixibacteraceae bacterium]
MQRINIFLLLLLLIGFASCMKDEVLWQKGRMNHKSRSAGLFITNEGNFMYGNSSLSYYDMEEETVENLVFFETNGFPMGDVAQSMVIRDTLGYVVINNSSKIYVINTNTFKCVGKIIGLNSPRYIHFLGKHKAYVTDLYAKKISIIDPLGDYEKTGIVNGKIIGSIDVSNDDTEFYQHPTEQMVQYKQFVFTNCWSYDNKILVIDTNTDKVVDTIEVLKQPTSLVIDRFNHIWTITDGGYKDSPYGQEAPGLQCIDAETRKVLKTWRFEFDDWPSEVQINGTKDILYFINKHVYRMPASLTAEPECFIKNPDVDKQNGGFYGLTIDPNTGEIYVANAIDYQQQGIVYRFDRTGIPVDTFKVGIIPGAFCFKPSLD